MTVKQGRQRLEATLASPALADKESVYGLLLNQILATSEEARPNDKSTHDLARRRFVLLWDFLELLRSASGEENKSLSLATGEETSNKGWKLKHDTGQMRVMYREGPEGTPFHTLLAEGLIYSPIVNALCLAWEAPSYKFWWPQVTFPTFKIIESRWVKRGGIGEDLSLIRVKVPWPVATREVLMYAFELEYLDEELIIVLLHTAPESPTTEEFIHGLKPSDLPEVSPDTVRAELAGGFVLQRVSAEQSYFRTVANLDIKLDFVPPWLINFISRQLIDLGFKLYQKTLISINENEGSSQHFKKLIESEPLYARIEVGLQSRKTNGKARETKNLLKRTIQSMSSSHNDGTLAKSIRLEEEISLDTSETESSKDISSSLLADRLPLENGEDIKSLHIARKHDSADTLEASGQVGTHAVHLRIDPEVQKALQILDRMISFVHAYRGEATKDSLLTPYTETSAGSSQMLCVNSVNSHNKLTNHVTDSGLADGTREQQVSISKNIPQMLEKVVPVLQVLDDTREHNAISKPSLVVEEQRSKLKWNCFCFKFPPLTGS